MARPRCTWLCVAALLVVPFVGVTGCSTYRSYDLDGCRVYGGIRYDVGDTAESFSPETAPWPTILAIISFPFSLVADTVFLPGTILHIMLYGAREPWNH